MVIEDEEEKGIYQTGLDCAIGWGVFGLRKYSSEKLAPRMALLIARKNNMALQIGMNVSQDRQKHPSLRHTF